ncbi:hypothetical protein PN499_01470 [Kamptonema animale CS-326]|jgi:hypothetical protein|nr:hypothetical protein [Kamptonema animale]MDB9509874.1 hypothetical protein [Kamptonema animale CS-326]
MRIKDLGKTAPTGIIGAIALHQYQCRGDRIGQENIAIAILL